MEGRGWTAVQELQVGERVLSEVGAWLRIESLRDTQTYAVVYNFRVAGAHTYFVGCPEWGFSVWVHNAYGAAHNAGTLNRLKTLYRLTEQYGKAGVRTLANGTYRFYGVIRPADKLGNMAGRRLVREWDPRTGKMRDWMEIVDHAGRVRIVHPKVRGVPTWHYLFDEFGKYIGKFGFGM